jgi:uncharacterized protein (TIGR00266 family)
MDFRITGQIAQTARVELDRTDLLWASKGSIVSHSPAVEWDLKIPGGVAGALRRSLSGEGITLVQIRPVRPAAQVVLGANSPGHIAVWDLADGPVLTTRGAFLAAWGDDLDISVTVARRAGAAFFGGAGLFLQRISGRGTVLVHGSGDFAEERLAQDEELVVSTGNLAAFADSVDYDIRTVGSLRKTLFGREGLFMTHLRGPGKVLLQTLKRTALQAAAKSS